MHWTESQSSPRILSPQTCASCPSGLATLRRRRPQGTTTTIPTDRTLTVGWLIQDLPLILLIERTPERVVSTLLPAHAYVLPPRMARLLRIRYCHFTSRVLVRISIPMYSHQLRTSSPLEDVSWLMVTPSFGQRGAIALGSSIPPPAKRLSSRSGILFPTLMFLSAMPCLARGRQARGGPCRSGSHADLRRRLH